MKISILKHTLFLLFFFSTPIAFAQLKEGMKAPEIILNDTKGKEVKLSDFAGQLILIDFWASWCGPCRKANPKLEALNQKYKSNGFVILGISLDAKKESWLNAVKKDNLSYPQVNDPAFWNSKVALSYGVEALPSAFLINKEGIVLAINPSVEEIIKSINQ